MNVIEGNQKMTNDQIKEFTLTDEDINLIIEEELLKRGNFKKKLQHDGEYRLNDYVIPDIKAIVMFFAKIAYNEGFNKGRSYRSMLEGAIKHNFNGNIQDD